jgi:hypothetical protein
VRHFSRFEAVKKPICRILAEFSGDPKCIPTSQTSLISDLNLKILKEAGGLWQGALETVLVFGPIFGVIVWATRRNLRKLENSRHKSRAENSKL